VDFSPIFPYSDDPVLKREQVWRNLQGGLLFEETGTFVRWHTPFSQLDEIAEDRRDSGDRTNWFLGKHLILDGIESYVGVMKWIWISSREPFQQVDDFLGFDYEGNEKFCALAIKITNLLGEPTWYELEKFGSFDLGTIQWKNEHAQITLIGIEQFACKYRLHVGLVGAERR
jgi:hypothetical protein